MDDYLLVMGQLCHKRSQKKVLKGEIVGSLVGVHLLECLPCNLRHCTCLRWTQMDQCYLQVVLAVMYLL